MALDTVALHLERLTVGMVASATSGARLDWDLCGFGPEFVVALGAVALFSFQVGRMIEIDAPGFRGKDQPAWRLLVLGRRRGPAGERDRDEKRDRKTHGEAITQNPHVRLPDQSQGRQSRISLGDSSSLLPSSARFHPSNVKPAGPVTSGCSSVFITADRTPQMTVRSCKDSDHEQRVVLRLLI